jgi:hypothetical protein
MTTTTHTVTLAEAEAACRDFAAQHPMPNVHRALALVESGRLSWFDIYPIFRDALAKALEEVPA